MNPSGCIQTGPPAFEKLFSEYYYTKNYRKNREDIALYILALEQFVVSYVTRYPDDYENITYMNLLVTSAINTFRIEAQQ